MSWSALTGAGAAAALALLSGSVLAAAVPAALILPRNHTPGNVPTADTCDDPPTTIVVSTGAPRP
jgi:hypothetical protein